jgi:tRNA-dihydrouridine synthase
MYIPVFGNGDIDSPEKAKQYFDRYGVDGIMIGRAAIGNPWIFRQIHDYLNTGKKRQPPSLKEKINAVRFHLTMEKEWKGERRAVLEMRRHYANYFKGIPYFKPYRMRLLQETGFDQVMEILNEIEEMEFV